MVVLGMKVRERSPEIVNQTRILITNRNAGRTSFPDSHQPNSIEAIIGMASHSAAGTEAR